MKLSKHQKKTIRLIQSGTIYDIPTYLTYFHLGREIKFSKKTIIEQFNEDDIPKKFYCRNDLQSSRNNTLTEAEYAEKLINHQINSDHYTAKKLELKYSSGIRHETFEDKTYTIDFYEGVYIANNFNDILDFLTLWQYLKSEMLILEIPTTCNAQMIGLFFEPTIANTNFPTSLEEKLVCIDYNTFTYEDKYYLKNVGYTLSHEHCAMCKEYMSLKIYPSTKLSLFTKNHFKTYEESAQNRALFTAWVAIFVSIILTFAPYLHQADNTNMLTIISDVHEIKGLLQSEKYSTELSSKLDHIINTLDSIIPQISNGSPKGTQ